MKLADPDVMTGESLVVLRSETNRVAIWARPEVAVAAAVIVACVGLWTLAILAPSGIPSPLMVTPTSKMVKLAEGDVTTAEPLVVFRSDTSRMSETLSSNTTRPAAS